MYIKMHAPILITISLFSFTDQLWLNSQHGCACVKVYLFFSLFSIQFTTNKWYFQQNSVFFFFFFSCPFSPRFATAISSSPQINTHCSSSFLLPLFYQNMKKEQCKCTCFILQLKTLQCDYWDENPWSFNFSNTPGWRFIICRNQPGRGGIYVIDIQDSYILLSTWFIAKINWFDNSSWALYKMLDIIENKKE